MADLDSRTKRASSVQMLVFSILAPVLPDGTIAQADRQHIIHTYSGILATENVIDEGISPARALNLARLGTPLTSGD